MSPESQRRWDYWIRTWVRHPHLDGLGESLCYQVDPTGRAALAWRYEDRQTAEHADDTTGRPLVSRVLVGQTSLLTPEMAITLCRTGLPATAGPPAGQVTAETVLPPIRAAELSALASERTADLDQEAARQEVLWQVVAAALSYPSIPLAIHIRDTDILKPPQEGLQCPLLWGLRRIVWPLLGTLGRGWSFSTFELPLGEGDPAYLPEILFRQAQETSLAPAMTRNEVKSRPFDPRSPDTEHPQAELAAWLVAEYQECGGDELRQLATGWCRAEQSLQPRLRRAWNELRAKYSPVAVSDAAAPFVPVSPAWSPEGEPDLASVPAEPDVSELVATAGSMAGEQAGSGPAGPERAAMVGSLFPEDEGLFPKGEALSPEDDVSDSYQPLVLTSEQAIYGQQSPASDEVHGAPGEPVTAPEKQVPDERTDALPSAADQDSQAGRSPAQDSEQDRSARPRLFEEEDQRQPALGWNAGIQPYHGLEEYARTAGREKDPSHSSTPEDFGYSAAPEHLAATDYRGNPAYPATPERTHNYGYADPEGYRGFPYPGISVPSHQPDSSPQPATQDRAGAVHSSPTWQQHEDPPLGNVPKEDAPPLHLRSQAQQPSADASRQFGLPVGRPAETSASDLLKMLPEARDDQEFEAILQNICNPDTPPDLKERVRARREIAKDGWYGKIIDRFGDTFPVDSLLADIFWIVVLPDLSSNPDVVKKIIEWSDREHHDVIAGLLGAAKSSGEDTWQSMMQILQPRLAYRWIRGKNMQQMWDPHLASQPENDASRSRWGRWRKP